jgi:hypothetical protein
MPAHGYVTTVNYLRDCGKQSMTGEIPDSSDLHRIENPEEPYSTIVGIFVFHVRSPGVTQSR